jgi:hypothetical protein
MQGYFYARFAEDGGLILDAYALYHDEAWSAIPQLLEHLKTELKTTELYFSINGSTFELSGTIIDRPELEDASLKQSSDSSNVCKIDEKIKLAPNLRKSFEFNFELSIDQFLNILEEVYNSSISASNINNILHHDGLAALLFKKPILLGKFKKLVDNHIHLDQDLCDLYDLSMVLDYRQLATFFENKYLAKKIFIKSELLDNIDSFKKFLRDKHLFHESVKLTTLLEKNPTAFENLINSGDYTSRLILKDALLLQIIITAPQIIWHEDLIKTFASPETSRSVIEKLAKSSQDQIESFLDSCKDKNLDELYDYIDGEYYSSILGQNASDD